VRPLSIVRSVPELRKAVGAWRARGESVALVPTMGALHEGHLSLLRLARDISARVVTSLYVNPAQFGPGEDFAAYPRREEEDAHLLQAAGCDLLYAPGTASVYPPGYATTITVTGVSEAMEGAVRPHHFAGVATVVTKLLIQCAPDIAVFGEKDYQQLQVIRRLAHDLDLPVEIVGAPIVRDSDGLALSSRNAYLSPAQRLIAPALHDTLAKAAFRLSQGKPVERIEVDGRVALQTAGFDAVDYFEVRASDDLAHLGPGPIEGAARILAAARLGRTRLLDNVAA
jgi:pantoate--beta-alanine ligase